MRTIKLKSLSLVNFKGVRSFDVSFDSDVVTITGGNATGKTTLYDAYLWLLFGKDSAGRGDGNGGFNVKTLDKNGKPIYRLEHSVTGVFDVDGREIKLQRCLVEKWNKVNGTTDEVMKDETQFFINDVRCGTKKEYQAEISEIIPEDVFRLITNPFAFNALKPEIQKGMLMEMAGTITNEEVAVLDDSFVALLEELDGKPLVTFLKELSAKKKACKDVLAVIPSNIDTAQRLCPTSENWEEIEAELESKKKLLADVDAKITDKSKASEEEYKRKAEIQKQRDPSGSMAEVYRSQVESNLPKSFTINIAIFKGTAKTPIEVEFDHYLSNGDVLLQLVSPGANELAEDYRDKCIDEVLDGIRAIAPDIAILEI